jgi:hypothetical protein
MNKSHLKVSRIMVKRTNLPSRGTTREVGGMISASSRKNTVRESRMEMDRDTWSKQSSFKGTVSLVWIGPCIVLIDST